MLESNKNNIRNALPSQNLRYAPHSKHEDEYFKDHRHHLSKREQMRAIELDPHHFYKVEQEPVHHEHSYFSEYDLHDKGTEEGAYFEDLIGYPRDYMSEGGHAGIDFSSVTASSEESNDIQFSINEDVQFKLSTSDNYQGRDVDVGIVMPGATTGQAMPAAHKQ